MTTTNRDADDYLTKAQESLASAEADFAARRNNSCVNRCYFACFQAAVCALVREGMASARVKHTHAAIARNFTESLVRRRKLYPQRLAKVLPELVSLRHEADYRPTPVSRTDTRVALASARDFVSTISRNV